MREQSQNKREWQAPVLVDLSRFEQTSSGLFVDTYEREDLIHVTGISAYIVVSLYPDTT